MENALGIDTLVSVRAEIIALGLDEIGRHPRAAITSFDSAWLPRVVATDPFCKFLFLDAPCPQRTLHFDGSPATLLEPSLHAELGMDAVYAPEGSERPFVDGEGRRPLHFSVAGLARVPSYRGDGASMALPFG